LRTPLLLTLSAALMVLPGMPAGAGDLLPRLGDDIGEFFTAGTLPVIGVGAAATAAALLLEDPCGNPGFLGPGAAHDLSDLCHHTMGLPLLGASVLVWGTGALDGSEGTEVTGQMLTEGLLLTYGAAGILKLGSARTRPDGSDRMSFPSAHAAGTACTAVILWDRCGAGAGIPMAAVAAFTALSRVHLHHHYPSDVIAGAAIGISIGLAVTRTHDDGAGSSTVHPSPGLMWSSRDGFGVYF